MKHIPNIVGGLLGLMFIAFSLMVLMHLGPTPPAPPEGSPPALFMGAMMPTGYMTFVKVMELVGGLLVAIPKTRNFGLLVLGPIIVNILAFHVFIMNSAMIFDPVLITVCVFAAYLLWDGRKAFAGLLR